VPRNNNDIWRVDAGYLQVFDAAALDDRLWLYALASAMRL
jgi:hypothetical protein